MNTLAENVTYTLFAVLAIVVAAGLMNGGWP